jgi:peroxiredoxin
VELRRAVEEAPDVVILWVMADRQINAKTLRFIDGNLLRDRVRFLRDPESRVIDRFRIRRPDPEPIEKGVPHPSTYVLDREGRIQLVDIREDFHVWIDPAPLLAALAAAP